MNFGSRTLFPLVCVLILLLPGLAWATSGLEIREIETHSGSKNPPCGEETDNIFKLRITNTNSGFLACKEEVNVTAETIRACDPSDTCEFLGFSTSSDLSSMTNASLTFTLDDDSSELIYFAIRTGPSPSRGCDFQEMEVNIKVCDSGGPCIWDLLDKRCEPPTPYTKTLRLEADQAYCPTSEVGPATLTGMVTDSSGDPVRGARVELTRGCLGSASYVQLQTNTEVTSAGTRQAGSYELADIPLATGYTFSVTRDGVTYTATIDVTSTAVVYDVVM